MGFEQLDREATEKEQRKARMMKSSAMKEFFGMDAYHKPLICKECSGIMVYKGVGEYKCEDCGALDYDDYGKVRNYIEAHHGATTTQVSEETGVSQKAIRTMLKESRLEVSADSRDFLRCEMCGKDIRFGRFCPKCEAEYRRKVEAEARAEKKNMTGYGSEHIAEEGTKRFTREK